MCENCLCWVYTIWSSSEKEDKKAETTLWSIPVLQTLFMDPSDALWDSLWQWRKHSTTKKQNSSKQHQLELDWVITRVWKKVEMTILDAWPLTESWGKIRGLDKSTIILWNCWDIQRKLRWFPSALYTVRLGLSNYIWGDDIWEKSKSKSKD